MTKKNVCIIPARGGSKRIPKKNIIDFFDKPMIGWTIEAALEANIFDKVIVSTDCENIAEVSRKLGADVPFLRQEKSDDVSSSSEATIACLKQIEAHYGIAYENVSQLMANCPLRTSKEIVAAYEFFITNGHQFQISSFKFGWMNPWWAFKVAEGKPEALFPEALKSRSQDLPHLYCPTGAIWFAKTSELIKANTFYGTDYRLCEMNWLSAIDIDDDSDLEMAKALYMLRNGLGRSE